MTVKHLTVLIASGVDILGNTSFHSNTEVKAKLGQWYLDVRPTCAAAMGSDIGEAQRRANSVKFSPPPPTGGCVRLG